MFRDDAQLSRACTALLATVRLAHLWSEHGPTTQAAELLEASGGPLSSGERVMLLVAWAFWNGSGGITVAEVLKRLDLEPAEALCSLVIASKRGSGTVDQWLATYAGSAR